MTEFNEGSKQESKQYPKRISEKGYYGVPFEDIPEELRGRVQGAAEAAKKGGHFSINFIEQEAPEGQQPVWSFGDYTDVYVFDNDSLHVSYHRAGNRQYRTFISGGGDPRQIDAIASGLGFDKTKAEVIPGRGWLGNPNVDNFTRQTTPMGPYYGQRQEPRPTK